MRKRKHAPVWRSAVVKVAADRVGCGSGRRQGRPHPTSPAAAKAGQHHRPLRLPRPSSIGSPVRRHHASNKTPAPPNMAPPTKTGSTIMVSPPATPALRSATRKSRHQFVGPQRARHLPASANQLFNSGDGRCTASARPGALTSRQTHRR